MSVSDPLVSVVLVNFRGANDTIDAIGHLRSLNWPALEIIVVENRSGDDSAQQIRTAHPDISLIVAKQNLGFAGGCNLGVEHANGEILAFLNNDARPDAAWISAAVERFRADPTIGAVASRVLDWDGKRVDFIDAALAWFGQGYKPFTGDPLADNEREVGDVLFGTGAAMFVRSSVYRDLGGFDERYFMFFEDVDLGWRLNLAGWRFAYEPKSIAFHKHHASMAGFGSFKETYLLERNALYTMYKNLGDEALARLLPATMALSIRRAVARGRLDSASFDLRKGADDSATMSIDKEAVSAVFAIDQFVTELPKLQQARALVQSTRVVSDAKIWPLFGDTDAPSSSDTYLLDGYDNLVSAFDTLREPALTRVLIITGDPIGKKMAGPAIRSWHMAEALAVHHSVTLVSTAAVEPVEAPFRVVHIAGGDDRAMSSLEADADVIVFQGLALAQFESIRRTKKIMVCDIYDPMHVEQLEQSRELGRGQWDRQVGDATAILNEQLRRGDFFLCASERQRQFYLGQLAALGRVNPANYADDPHLRRLIDVVPFGLDDEFPVHSRAVLRGERDGIGADDKVLLWSGGLYNWFDPITLIRAVAALSDRHANVRLFFQGTKHPHPGVPVMGIVAECQQVARDLGIEDTNVFFNDSWVDYADRHNFLREADAGVSTHFNHLETTFSFRTRVLDFLWAGLPMVVTEGDHFAELVEREQLGVVVPAEDVTALAAALERVLYNEEFRAMAAANVARVRDGYEWGRVLRPLAAFIESPTHAADRLESGVKGAGLLPRRRGPKKHRGLAHDAKLAFRYLRQGGPSAVISRVRSRIRRSMQR